jgi:hypothetical protein
VIVVAACDRPCSLTATGVATTGRRSFTLGRAAATLDAAGSRTLALRVQHGLARFLKQHGRTRARLTVRAVSDEGGSAVATRVVTVRR